MDRGHCGAQRLLNKQLETDWSQMLNEIVVKQLPCIDDVIKPLHPEYYWSADDTEWATDIMFKSRELLDELYPSFLHHAMRFKIAPTVMRYFGRRDSRGLAPRDNK